MSAKAVLGSLIIGGCLGYGIAHPVPETRFIEKPAPPPEVVVKEKVVTEEVQVPLPAACLKATQATDRLVDQMNGWNNKAQKFYDELESVDMRMLEDQTANNDLVIRIYEILAGQEDDLYNIFGTEAAIETQQKTCKDALESGQ